MRNYYDQPWGAADILSTGRGHPDLAVLRKGIFLTVKFDLGMNEMGARVWLLCELELTLEPVLRAREIFELVELVDYAPPEAEEDSSDEEAEQELLTMAQKQEREDKQKELKAKHKEMAAQGRSGILFDDGAMSPKGLAAMYGTQQ